MKALCHLLLFTSVTALRLYLPPPRRAIFMSENLASVVCITPIGPFCPFRSSACRDDGLLASGMSELSSMTPRFMTELARIQLSMQTGSEVDPAQVRRIGEEMLAAQTEWEQLLARMGMTDDFQAREYKKMTMAHLDKSGQSLETIGKMIRWQADCMIAYADRRPPPFPPAGVDLEMMAKQASAGSSSPMSAIGAANAITSSPFTGGEAVFDSPIVKEEYEKLCRDHNALVRMGEGYGSFDPLGKIAFIDAIEKVEERWDILFSRFALLGAVNPEFREQTETFLEGMGLTPQTFRELLRDAHQKMRHDAEQERILGPQSQG